MDYEEAGENYRQRFSDDSSSDSGKGKVILIILGFVFFIAIVVALFFLLSNASQRNISEKRLLEGATLDLEENNSLKVKVGEDDHNIEIGFVGLDSVDIVIKSDPIYATLKVGEVKKFDLNEDGNFDLRVELLGIENGKAKILVRRIETVVCEERWQCSQWGRCIEGQRERNCVDSNNCGTLDNKPSLVEECLEIEIIEENVTVTINDSSGLNDSLTNSTESNFSDSNLTNNSNGAVISSDESLEDYISRVKAIDCSDYSPPNCRLAYLDDVSVYSKFDNSTFSVYDEDCGFVCFGKALRNSCQKASVTVISDSGTSRRMDILGFSDTGACSVNVDFEFVHDSDFENKDYEGSLFACSFSLDEASLTDFSCPDDNCLEENLPGQTSFGILSSIFDESCIEIANNSLQDDIVNDNGCSTISLPKGVLITFDNAIFRFLEINNRGHLALEVGDVKKLFPRGLHTTIGLFSIRYDYLSLDGEFVGITVCRGPRSPNSSGNSPNSAGLI